MHYYMEESKLEQLLNILDCKLIINNDKLLEFTYEGINLAIDKHYMMNDEEAKRIVYILVQNVKRNKKGFTKDGELLEGTYKVI